MRIFKMNGAKATQLTMILSVIDVVVVFTLLFSCENLPFAGVNTGYAVSPTTATPQ